MERRRSALLKLSWVAQSENHFMQKHSLDARNKEWLMKQNESVKFDDGFGPATIL